MLGSLVMHSHITIGYQPNFFRSLKFFLSRDLFALNFSSQNFLFDFGKALQT